MRDIGKNIRAARTGTGLTQDELAEKLHVTRQTVSNYETGRSRPDVDMLTALAEAMGADVTELLYGPEKTTRKSPRRSIVALSAAAVLWLLGFPPEKKRSEA